MVEDVEDVRVALGLGKISLLGHSYGGALAQAYAFKYQQHLSHLILNSTLVPDPGNERSAGEAESAIASRQIRYPSEYAAIAWAHSYFPAMYGAVKLESANHDECDSPLSFTEEWSP